MNKLMFPVVRDFMAEKKGIDSMVGQSVEVVKIIPAYALVTVAMPGMGKPKTFPTNKPVYLVNAPRPRFSRAGKRSDQVMIMYKGYVGNDIYSAKELGVGK